MRTFRVRDQIRQILSLNEPPARTAWAFALGVFIGMSPLLGIHTLLGVLLAWRLRLNKLVTLAGVYITNPWTIVPIYTFGTWIGVKMLGMDHLFTPIDWSHVTFMSILNEFRPLIMPFIIGNTALGLVSAAIGYVVILKAVKRNRG